MRHYRSQPKYRNAKPWRNPAANLTDGYIRSLFCNNGSTLRSKDIPRELLEIKRLYLKLHRLIKEKQQW